MRRTLLTLGALAAAGFALAAAPEGHGPLPHSTRQEAGQAIFQGKGNCFTCHRQDAKGTPLAPDLTDDQWVNFDERPTLQEVETLIKEGVAQPEEHPAPMPPMGGARLSDEEVAQVAEYVLGLSQEADGR